MSKETFEQIGSVLRSSLTDAQKLAEIETIIAPLTGYLDPTFPPPTKITCLINYLSGRFRFRHHRLVLVEVGLRRLLVVE